MTLGGRQRALYAPWDLCWGRQGDSLCWITECENILGDVLALEQKSCICEAPLEVFIQENKCEIRYHKNSPFEAKEIVQRARMARDRLEEDKYNLVFNNCEHFVNWCIYDKEFSIQVMGWGSNYIYSDWYICRKQKEIKSRKKPI